jgi:hypothetical protein
MSKYQQCECNFCGGALRFEISRANQLVNCHECGMETVLFIPGAERPYPQEEFFLQPTNIGWAKSSLGFRNVVGLIVNDSNKDLDWVRIEFTLVNREAMPVGSTSDCLINFPIHGVWRFQAPVFQNDGLGVGEPLISCEYGKIFLPKKAIPAVPTVAAPARAPEAAPVQRLVVNDPKAVSQWAGLRITGGVTGVAHRQS